MRACTLGLFGCVQLFVTLMDCGPPGSSVHGILQARIPEWVPMPFSRGSSRPSDWARVSCIAGGFFRVWATREDHVPVKLNLKNRQKSRSTPGWSFADPCYSHGGFPGGSGIKNPPAMQEMQETWVPTLGWGEPLEEEMTTCSRILAWKNLTDRGAWRSTVQGVAKSWVQPNNWAHTSRTGQHCLLCF